MEFSIRWNTMRNYSSSIQIKNWDANDLLAKLATWQANDISNDNLGDDELIDFLIKFPKLLERPIVIKNSKAVIGRPPENILNFL